MRIHKSIVIGLCVCCIAASSQLRCRGAKAPPSTANTRDTADVDTSRSRTPPVPLHTRQEAIAVRYKRFENTLLQMAEQMRRTDPDRAELLIRAIGQSQEQKSQQQIRRIVSLLSKEQYGDAIDRQSQLIATFHSLLELLQSEDRRSELEKERERIQKLLKDLNRLIGKEKAVRAATERGEPLERVTGNQQKVADDADQLIDEIDRHDTEHKSDSDGDKPNKRSSDGTSDASSADEPNGEQNPDTENGSPNDSDARDSDSNAGDPKQQNNRQSPSQEGNSQPAQPSQSSPNSGSPQSSDQEQQKTPGRDQIDEARQQMEKAIEELEKQAADKASDRQDEALRKLAEAKEKLEKILRQLREEERSILLTALEARFRKMLAMQQFVYNETLRLDAVPDEDRTARHRERSRKLSFDENDITVEADKALALLRDEGSSVAFPEAVEQMRDDIRTIAGRLERNQIGPLTQTIEKDVIDALEEVIDALHKELEKQEDEQSQSQESPPQQAGEPPLVDVLAELKMLRTLQLRVNRRTKKIGQLIEGEQARKPDVVEQLEELAKRQTRLQQATYDLVSGRNR